MRVGILQPSGYDFFKAATRVFRLLGSEVVVVQDRKQPRLSVDAIARLVHKTPARVHIRVAETEFERGQVAQAASQFEKLYKTYPDGNKAVAALYRLGLCYEKMGHENEAKEAFQNVMTVYPGSWEALESEKRLKLAGGSNTK